MGEIYAYKRQQCDTREGASVANDTTREAIEHVGREAGILSKGKADVIFVHRGGHQTSRSCN